MDSFILRTLRPNDKNAEEENRVLGTMYRLMVKSRNEKAFNDRVKMVNECGHERCDADTLGLVWHESAGVCFPIQLLKGNVYYISLNGRTVDTINLNK